MEDLILEKDALSIAKENFEDFLTNHDVKYIAEDVVYKNMSTGEVYNSKE